MIFAPHSNSTVHVESVVAEAEAPEPCGSCALVLEKRTAGFDVYPLPPEVKIIDVT
jgi:hypothetical protein